MKILHLVLLSLLVSMSYRSIAQTSDPDVIEFAFITDTHQYGSTADVRRADASVEALVEYCHDHPQIQFVLFGGDFFNAYDTNHRQALKCLRRSAKGFSGLKVPFYATRGNHDCNGKRRDHNGHPDNSQIITDSEYYRIFSPLSPQSSFYAPKGIVTDTTHPQGNYYYRDFEQQRFRLIVLNNYDQDSLEVAGYHDEQLSWLQHQALDFSQKADPTQWCYLILGHCFMVNHQLYPITRLLHEQAQHPGPRMVGILSGHFHEDMYDNTDGYNLIRVSRGYSTGSELLTDQNSISFDHFILNTRTCQLQERRIGRERSRLFTYDKPRQLSPALAFAGCEGMGAYTEGGQNGRQLHVTSLADSGEGTLRWALEQQGSRRISFDIAGPITLHSPLIIEHDSVSLCGPIDSSAEPVTIVGAPLVVNASEVVLRHLQVGTLTDGDFGQTQLVLDHITAHNDTATALSIRRTAYVTVQCCSISTGSLTQPALLAGGACATYHSNLVHGSHHAIMFADAEGENRYIQMARNVITDCTGPAFYGGGHQGEYYLQENLLVPSVPECSDRLPLLLQVADDGTCRYHVQNNVIEGYQRKLKRNADMVHDLPGQAYMPAPTGVDPRMLSIARPRPIDATPSCLVIAAFPSHYFFGNPAHHYSQVYTLPQRK